MELGNDLPDLIENVHFVDVGHRSRFNNTETRHRETNKSCISPVYITNNTHTQVPGSFSESNFPYQFRFRVAVK